MKRMRLVDLLYKISDSVTIWISEDPSVSTGIYFGFVGDIQLKTAMGYDVVEVYRKCGDTFPSVPAARPVPWHQKRPAVPHKTVLHPCPRSVLPAPLVALAPRMTGNLGA